MLLLEITVLADHSFKDHQWHHSCRFRSDPFGFQSAYWLLRSGTPGTSHGQDPVPGNTGHLSKHEQHPDPQYTGSLPFTGDDVFKLIRDLSGGERGRVSLAKLMLSDANFLLLDEPTNHLDITSKEILESALNRYTGTVLYVSHDRYFINRTATRILDLTNGSFINYIGNYDYYLEKKEDVEAAFAARQMAQTAANHPTGTNSPQATSTASGISSSRTSQTAMTASSAGSPADGKNRLESPERRTGPSSQTPE